MELAFLDWITIIAALHVAIDHCKDIPFLVDDKKSYQILLDKIKSEVK